MPDTTPIRSIPYPKLDRSEAADGPAAIHAVAAALDDAPKYAQGPFSSRPVSTSGSPGIIGRRYYATDIRVEFLDTGTGWQPLPRGDSVNSLPGTVVDGYTIDYVADATNGIVWKLRYRAASASAHKWEFVGGGWLYQSVDASGSPIDVTYADIATAGPSITVPLAGDYLVEVGAKITAGGSSQPTGGLMSFAVGGTAAIDADAAEFSITAPGLSPLLSSSAQRRSLKLNLAAATALVSKYKALTSGTTAVFERRFISVQPVRVG